MMEQGKSDLPSKRCLGDAGGKESLLVSGIRKSFMRMLALKEEGILSGAMEQPASRATGREAKAQESRCVMWLEQRL